MEKSHYISHNIRIGLSPTSPIAAFDDLTLPNYFKN
jgi:hypothetical protein